MNRLLDGAWLEAVELPGEPPRYEPAGKRHHDHFHCRRCTRVFDVDHCPITAPRLPGGFLLEGHSALLRGLCRDCAPGGRARGGERRR